MRSIAAPYDASRRIGSFATAAILLTFNAWAEDFTLARYRALVSEYRDGEHREPAAELRRLDHEELAERNEELPASLDLDRPDERRLLVGAVLIHGEAAMQERLPERRDFYLDQAGRLSAWLGEQEHTGLQKELHLAVVYGLFQQRRIVDALHAARPAAARYATDQALQLAHASLAEVVGWIQGSSEILTEASSAYERVLSFHPDDARARVRLGRVLMLRGDHEQAIEHLEAALRARLEPAHRFVGLLSLGNARRNQGDIESSIDAYRKALEVAPASQKASVALSFALRELGRLRESTEVIESTFENHATYDDLWNRYLMADANRYGTAWRRLRTRLR